MSLAYVLRRAGCLTPNTLVMARGLVHTETALRERNSFFRKKYTAQAKNRSAESKRCLFRGSTNLRGKIETARSLQISMVTVLLFSTRIAEDLVINITSSRSLRSPTRSQTHSHTRSQI